MIRVVTIEREYGSGAAAISRAVAGELGFKLWDGEIDQEIARRVHCDVAVVEKLESRCDPMYHRLIRAFMRGSYEASMRPGLEHLDSERLSVLFTEIVAEIAASGRCVIVGRGAPWFLRARNDAFHAFLYAPYAEKLRRTVAQGKTRPQAEELLSTVDHERAAFVKKYYGKDWPDRHLYNLMLNTKVGDAIAVKLILDQIEMLNLAAAS
jgi:cytidylate kinase